MIRRSQPLLLQMTPESKNTSAVKCVTLTTRYGNSNAKTHVLHGDLAKFSQNEDMHLALIQTGDRRLAEASPHDNLWGIGLSACDPRASFPVSWCAQNVLDQALEHPREILRWDITAPLCNPVLETPAPRDDTGDTVFEVDSVTHLRLDTDPPSANTQTATLSDFTNSVADDHALGFHQFGARRPRPRGTFGPRTAH